MGRKGRSCQRPLVSELARKYPEIHDPVATIVAGEVAVDGFVRRNPRSMVRMDASIALRSDRALRGEAKLAAALERFAVPVADRVALDLGAAAGGFTRVLLARGARRVYAVDAGHGQLLGSLRQDGRVVNLERTNLAELDALLVPEPVEVVTLDLSYLALAEAIGQLRVDLAPAADAVALVKPQFELRLATPPTGAAAHESALASATAGFERAGWRVVATMRSPVTGAGGAVEHLVHAQRLLR
jgi:23S rRNA (cytidine1920-2'-O)/16S rRNA (cytidine1409-2'-O)-methyltransferase